MKLIERSLVAIGSVIEGKQKWLSKNIYAAENGRYYIKIDDITIEVERFKDGYYFIK